MKPTAPEPRAPALRAAEARVLALQRGEGTFDEALQAVLAYQTEHIPALDAFWKGRGFDHTQGGDVPPVPTDVFKHVALCSDEAPAERTFKTSGTTVGQRGVAPRISTQCYDHGARIHARAMLLPGGEDLPWVSLVPPAHQAPHSSLAHMVTDLSEALSTHAPHFFAGDQGLALQPLIDHVATLDGPVLLFGTSLAFDALLSAASRSALKLHPGSRVVDTGGFKGKAVTLSPEDHHARLCDAFGLRPRDVLSEYSMTELSSQLYTDSLLRGPGDHATRRLVPPAWCRVIIRDPADLRPLGDGETGLVSFLDLANVDTPCAILTSDLGTLDAHGLELHGRAPGATPRGCSLATEELLALQHRGQQR